MINFGWGKGPRRRRPEDACISGEVNNTHKGLEYTCTCMLAYAYRLCLFLASGASQK